MKYYKVVNTGKGHHGLFYKEGYNEDPNRFIPFGDCTAGGIYFSREDIFAFLNYGDTVFEVEPIGTIYKNPGSPNKWKAHAVNLKRVGLVQDVETIKLLLDNGADVHARDDYALRRASGKGYTEIVKLLLDRGADVDAYDGCALRWASEKRHTEIVKMLLDKGADVRNNAALRRASDKGHTEIVKLLLDNGADVHALDNLALRWASGRVTQMSSNCSWNMELMSMLLRIKHYAWPPRMGIQRSSSCSLNMGADIHAYGD